MKASEIILELHDLDQLLLVPDSLFYGKRMLNPDAEEVIIEEVTKAALGDHIRLKIHLLEDKITRKDEILAAIHKHFNYRREKSETKLKKVLHLGWQSLLISIVFLGILISLTLLIIKLLPEGGLSITFREILIILGWVALWRPADLLLYEWRPFKREINLFRRLERCDLEIVTRKV